MAMVALSSNLFAGLVMDKNSNSVPGFKLELEEQVHLTDTAGVLIPKQLINAPVGKKVKIYRTDGFCYDGMVTAIEESDDVFKIYGTIYNNKDTQFGFVLAKGGIFAGAVVDNDKVYAVEFSEALKGFILVRSYKHEKPRL
jgi:hypothetical protein